MSTTTISTATSAESLAPEINRLHRAASTAAQQALDHAHAAGLLLIEAKSLCKHGEWEGWLKANFEGSTRTARAYIQVANHWPAIEAKRQHIATLTYGAALKLVAEPTVDNGAGPTGPKLAPRRSDPTMTTDEQVAVMKWLWHECSPAEKAMVLDLISKSPPASLSEIDQAQLRLLALNAAEPDPDPLTDDERARLAECERKIGVALPVVNKFMEAMDQCSTCAGQSFCNLLGAEAPCAIRSMVAAECGISEKLAIRTGWPFKAVGYLSDIEKMFAENQRRGYLPGLHLHRRIEPSEGQRELFPEVVD